MIGAIFWVNAKVENSKLNEISDNILMLFRHEMEIQKSNALFLSVSLSGDTALKEALVDEDEELGYKILIDKLNKLTQYTFIKDVRMQLLTKDLYIFARSWDNNFAGMPLEGFREDLQLLRKIRQPKVSIDPGRLLTIKATTPIKQKGDLIGYVEAIKTFDEITMILRKYEIELTVLMYDDFLNVATLMRENPSFGSFVVSNKNYNNIVLSDLKVLDRALIERENFITSEKFLHVIDVMRDSAGEKIGYYLLSVAKEKLDNYAKMKNDISFLLNISKKDLYKVVESQEGRHEGYVNQRAQLQRYDKEQLIDMLIDKADVSKKIEGKIR